MIALVLLGLGSGLVSALLFGTVATGSVIGALLFWLAPMPLMIVGLGWHWLLAALGALGAGIVLDQVLSQQVALSYSAALGAPATLLSYLTLHGLRRDAEGGQVPSGPGSLLFAIVIYAALVVVIGAMLIEPTLAGLEQRLMRSTELVLRLQLDLAPDAPLQMPNGADLSAIPEVYAKLAPAVASASIAMTLTLSLWLAALAVRQSGRLPRPWPTLYGTRLPRAAGPLIVAAIALTFAGGYAAFAGNVLTTVLLFAFMLQGFATVHALTRGMTARIPLLMLMWLSVAIIGLPGLVLIAIGMIDQAFDLRRRKSDDGPSSNS